MSHEDLYTLHRLKVSAKVWMMLYLQNGDEKNLNRAINHTVLALHLIKADRSAK